MTGRPQAPGDAAAAAAGGGAGDPARQAPHGATDALPAVASDLAATHARAFATLRPWSAAEFAALLCAPGVILTGDAGAFVLGRVTLDEAEVLTVATDPGQRRHGRARAALDAFHAAAAAAGAGSAFLEVAEDNAAATGLYRASGYAEVGRRRGYYRDAGGRPVDALVMRRAPLVAPLPHDGA